MLAAVELRALSARAAVLSAQSRQAARESERVEAAPDPMRGAVVQAFSSRIQYAATGHVDHKTELQEALARRGRAVSYTVVEVEGPPHDRSFKCAATIDGAQVGIGTGRSKKAAEQEAARQALAKLGIDAEAIAADG